MKKLLPKNVWTIQVPVISTAHVTLEDKNFLDDPDLSCNPDSNKWLMVLEHGWVLYLKNVPDNLHGVSDAFRNLVRILKKHEVYMVRLDADGDILEALPLYDW